MICCLMVHCMGVLPKYLTCDHWKAIQPKRNFVPSLVGSVDKDLGQLHSMCNELFSLIAGKKDGLDYVKKIFSDEITKLTT